MHCLHILSYFLPVLVVLPACSVKRAGGDTDSQATSGTAATTSAVTTAPQTSTGANTTSATTTASASTDTTSTGDTPSTSDTTTSSTTTTTSTTTTSTTTSTGATTARPIEPWGPNPCGACAPGEYCLYTPSDMKACEFIECHLNKGPVCGPCFAAPLDCPADQLAQCVEMCGDATLLGFGVAEDGVLVIHCDIWADTGCGP